MSQVAKDSEWVCSKSKLVKIDLEALENFSILLFEKIKNGQYKSINWSADNPLHPKSSDHYCLDWIFLIDSLNFSFWPNSGEYFSIENQVGYWALCAAINRSLREGIPITKPQYYRNITKEDAQKLFRTDQSGREIPLLNERIEIMRHNGRILCDKFDGTFKSVLQKSNQNAQNLLELVCDNFPSFRDEATFQGRIVKIYKRAQILIADIWACFDGKNEGHFEDIDSLTIFADYRIPQTLHYFGVLKYVPELMELLKSERLLENGSSEEVEIRCNSIHAVELIRSKLLKLSNEHQLLVPNSIEIDFYIWGYRRNNSNDIEQKSPYHKVRCIFY